MGERALLKALLEKLLLAVALLATASLPGEAGARPSEGGGEVLARVNGEPVTLDELLHHLSLLHGEVDAPEAPVRGPDPGALLERIINARLVVQEAQNIGLDELPEVTALIESAHQELVRQAVIEERVGAIDEGDPAEVERLYRDAVREAQVESVLFPSVEAATAFQMSVRDGTDFAFLADKMIQQGKAERREEPQYLKASQLLPQVARSVVDLEVGAVSPPIELDKGWTVVRLLELRYPDDPEARATAEGRAREARQQAELAKYSNELRSRYAAANAKLLESLDYDAPSPGIEALRDDERVLVEIRGGEPITVAALTARIEKKFFHGLDRALARQRVTGEVPGVLDRMILERAVQLEAKRLGIEERPAFRNALRSQEEGLIFGAFVSKVIDPKVTLDDAELRAYYEEHRADFTAPEMMRLEGLAFTRRADAEAALEKLRQGADPAWTRTHAPGRTDPESVDPAWRFAGQLLPVPGLPPEVRQAVTGAGAGDFRICAQPGGPVHVLQISEAFPPRPQPYEAVESEITVRKFAEKRQLALDRWLAELRKVSEIEIVADDARVRSLLGLAPKGKA